MKNRFFSVISALIIAAMVFTTVAAAQPPAAAAAQVVNKGLKATIDTVYSESSLKDAIVNKDGRLSIIVQLAEPPLALYAGGVPNLAPTSAQATGKVKLDANSPASQAYVQHLVDVQAAFVSQVAKVAPSASATFTYQTAFNGVAMKVSKAEISRIAMMSGVAKIYPDQVRYAQMDASLPLINAPAMWTKLGGQSKAGKGIKVADVDTGLDVKNPMFSGTGFTAPLGFPKGFCVTSPADPNFVCNGKVIVGRWYFDTGAIPTGYELDPAEVMSPFGIASHGSHTAGTITGDPVVAHVDGFDFNLSGVAPAAYLMVYKGLFSVKNLTDGSYSGSGSDSMLVAALNAAVGDGADVINNSWGGGAGSDPNTSIYKPLIAAITAAGTLVVFSAGNDGPGGGTIGCPGCVEDALTVAASTTNRILANQFDVTGPGTVPTNLTKIGVFASGTSVAHTGVTLRYNSANPVGCTASGGFPSGFFTGAFALISRGSCTFAEKQANAVAAGATGVVVINNVAGPPVGMGGVDPTKPIYMMDLVNGKAVRSWVLASTPPVTINIGATIVKINNNAYQDVMAGFSSVGPDGDPNVLKPDITAPGVNILSASAPADITGATEPWFEFLQGTSMAAPHITGSAALVMQQHPDWTPWQVRTALTSTAVQTPVQPDGVTQATPFQMGSGRVDLSRASSAGLTFTKSSFANSNCILTCSWTVNLKNVTAADATWNAAVATKVPELSITVNPPSVDLAPGGNADVTVTADVTQVLPGSYVFGSVTWKDAGGVSTDAYLPVVVTAGTSTNAAVLSETVDKANANGGDDLTYTVNVTNPYTASTTFTVQSPLSQDLTYKAGSATGGLTYNAGTRTLTGSTKLGAATLNVAPTGAATRYVAATPGAAGVTDLKPLCGADAICDEVVFDITGMDYYYMGVHYVSAKLSSNGFMAPGTAATTSAATPQMLPDTANPNNVIAPLWTDLDFANADAHWLLWGTATETVFEWQNAEAFGSAGAAKYNFEIRIVDTTNQIIFAYGPMSSDVTTHSAGYNYEVGAENLNGTLGSSYFYFDPVNGEFGTAPAAGTDLKVVNVLNSASMTFVAKATLKSPLLPVITNPVNEVSNFNGETNKAVAYSAINIDKVLLPIIFK